MKNLGTLLLAFFLSALVAGIVQNQLAIVFRAREEFIAVVMLFVLTAIITTIALGVALAAARSVAGIDWTALALLVAMALLLGGLVGAGAVAERKLSFNTADFAVLAQVAVPTALMIGIQW